MASEVYEYVPNCSSFIKNRGTQIVQSKHLRFFPPSGPLKFVTMDIFVMLPRRKLGNPFMLVISYSYMKLMCATAMSTTTAQQVATRFLD